MGEVVISTARRRRGEHPPAGGTARARTIVRAAAIGLLLAACAAATARAETTTERSSSILIFPKVVFDGTRDTFIQISNTANSMVYAHCFYVNAAPFCVGAGDCVAGTCTGRCDPAVGRGRFQHLADQAAADALVRGPRAIPGSHCRSVHLRPAELRVRLRRSRTRQDPASQFRSVRRRAALHRGGPVRCSDQRQPPQGRGDDHLQ